MRKIFFLFIILSLPVFFNFRSLVKKPAQKENPQLLASKLPINTSTAIGKRKSAAAPGKQTYSISQTHRSPNFTEAVIDPEDVRLGQTQTMTVTINDEKAPITEVIAEIETDKGIIKNALNRISGTDRDGVWQGSWVVKDTHDTTYVTTFKAVNKIGEKGEARLSWTDPGCSTDANKGTSFTTTANCTITGVDGADGGTFTLAAGHTVTISAGATLVAGIFTIPASGGTLISNSTGGIDVASTNVICMTDADTDNYSPATTQYLATTSCAAGKRRRNLMTSVVTLDCNDTDANIRTINITGGTITNSGSNRINTFTSSGTLSVVCGTISSVEILVVGGGGGGGSSAPGHGGGAGGGAGGLRYQASLSIGSSTPVTVGAGGAGGAISAGQNGANGGNSVFSSITSTGGGGGGDGNANNNNAGVNGGSGGGAGYNWYGWDTVGTGISGQGRNGGQNGAGSGAGAGGGGGAGAVGGTPTNSPLHNGGVGGNGLAYSISGTSTYYAGGGAGSGTGTIAGGLGGGGGMTSLIGQNGTANTGGGGGGSYADYGKGGNGGSGIVIVKYPNP